MGLDTASAVCVCVCGTKNLERRMAIQGRGYYGIGTGKKDFGFSTNVTLPLSGGYNIPSADLMPHESRSGKGSGQASFAASKDDKVRSNIHSNIH